MVGGSDQRILILLLSRVQICASIRPNRKLFMSSENQQPHEGAHQNGQAAVLPQIELLELKVRQLQDQNHKIKQELLTMSKELLRVRDTDSQMTEFLHRLERLQTQMPAQRTPYNMFMPSMTPRLPMPSILNPTFPPLLGMPRIGMAFQSPVQMSERSGGFSTIPIPKSFPMVSPMMPPMPVTAPQAATQQDATSSVSPAPAASQKEQEQKKAQVQNHGTSRIRSPRVMDDRFPPRDQGTGAGQKADQQQGPNSESQDNKRKTSRQALECVKINEIRPQCRVRVCARVLSVGAGRNGMKKVVLGDETGLIEGDLPLPKSISRGSWVYITGAVAGVAGSRLELSLHQNGQVHPFFMEEQVEVNRANNRSNPRTNRF